ncbi:hypothetical protein JYU34_010038 [Plutella xylostella]|uniref:Uncharacterized protein n=1 Tax=Plutella xylostella TaxID=51655 RepID=A0ABQ7QHK9_PLUXY|nr:hypothetical protein JYU34_010038 [Plutella xylostella]
MLRSYGIQPFWLLPPSEYDLTDEEYYSLYSPYPKLDLEIFDNTDFDCRTPEEWMGLGLIEGEQHPCPGLAYIPRDETKTKKIYGGDKIQIFNNIYDWTNAAVFSFDKITDKWHIMALDGTKRRFDIPRIRLMFKADDPETFVQRIKFAVDHRNEVENNIRFYLYLDCLMLHALPEIPSNWMEQIMGLVRLNKKIVPDEVQLNILRQEAENLYAKMQGKMVMLYTMQLYPTSYNFINEPTPEYVWRVPEYCCYPCLMDDFPGRVKYNQWYSLYVLSESVSCIHLVVDECLKVESMLFFTSNYGRNVSLAEFDAAQQHTTTMMLKYLNISWLNNIAHAIRMSFRDVGKGSFNIYEKKWEFYIVSKLYRFMQLVRFRMQYALRYCIEQSMAMFVYMCETPCLCTYDCEEDFEWDPQDLLNSPFRSPTVTLFYFYLLMSADGPYYSTDTAQFEVNLI